MAKGDFSIFPPLFYYISGILLILLLYAGYQDFRKRKIDTFPFLIIDVGLLLYYLTINPFISIFLVPIIMEFYLKKNSILLYPLVILPPIFDPGVITISLAYSILLIKIFGIIVKNFGRGDIKVLETISVASPTYPNLPVQLALFPPVMAVTLMASIIGLISSLIVNSRIKSGHSIRKFSSASDEKMIDKEKFWIRNEKIAYKIPFVTYVSLAFTAFFILSLLRLV